MLHTKLHKHLKVGDLISIDMANSILSDGGKVDCHFFVCHSHKDCFKNHPGDEDCFRDCFSYTLVELSPFFEFMNK